MSDNMILSRERKRMCKSVVLVCVFNSLCSSEGLSYTDQAKNLDVILAHDQKLQELEALPKCLFSIQETLSKSHHEKDTTCFYS